jgi:hypothetical protein
MQQNRKKSLNVLILLTFIAILPFTQLVSYILGDNTGLDYRAYPSLIIFIYLIVFMKFSKESIALLSIFILYSILFSSSSLSGRAGYMIDFSLTCLAFLFLPQLDLYKIKLRTIDLFVIILCYGIIIAYILTSHYVSEDNGFRNYYVGFIIPHAFAYYMAIFIYYFMKRNKAIFAVVPLLLGLYTGTRVGIILCLLSVTVFYYEKYKSKKLHVILTTFISGIVIIIVLYNVNPLVKNQFDLAFNAFKGFDFTLFKNDNDSLHFTSNRSLLMSIGLEKIFYEGFSFNNLFGRGPRASYDFIENALSWRLWFHNDYLDILFNLGFINLIIYISAIIYYFRTTKSLYFILFVSISAFTNGFFLYSSFSIIGLHYIITYIRNLQISSGKTESKSVTDVKIITTVT